MKLFSEYLAEAEEHKDGTYAALLPTTQSRTKLHSWMEKQNIERLVEAKEYHCTVVFSTNPVPEVEKISVDFPMYATIKGWKVFGDDKKMLVAALAVPSAKKLFDETIKIGAKTDYPEYVPHITVATNFKGEIPSEVPQFSIEFYKFKVAPMDKDFSYDDNDD
jgi:2'-5' RNA ligase